MGSAPSSQTCPAAEDSRAETVPFFLVGTRKLVVLSVVTLGLYEIYWFYRHWRQLQRVGGEDVWPAARTLFAGLFSYALFVRVNEEADVQGAPSLFSPVMLAIAYFVALSSSRLGAPLWIVIAFTIVPLALAQSIVNGLPQVRSLPSSQRNERFSRKNWAGVTLFVLLIGLSMLPEPPADDVRDSSLAESMNQPATDE